MHINGPSTQIEKRSIMIIKAFSKRNIGPSIRDWETPLAQQNGVDWFLFEISSYTPICSDWRYSIPKIAEFIVLSQWMPAWKIYEL